MLYFQSIFPLQFTIVKDELKLSNYKEIEKRITKIDNILIDKYKGEGINYIRTAFLKQFEKEEIENQFINSLGFISVINLTLKRYAKSNNLDFKWRIPSIDFTYWKLKMEDNTNDSISYSANQFDENEFLKALNEYRSQNKYNSIDDKELKVESDFLTKIQYENNSLNIVETNTSCKINYGKYFDYQEKISIKSVL